jgi:hypothetical protein
MLVYEPFPLGVALDVAAYEGAEGYEFPAVVFDVVQRFFNEYFAYAAAFEGFGYFGMRQYDDVAGKAVFDIGNVAFYFQLKLFSFFVHTEWILGHSE